MAAFALGRLAQNTDNQAGIVAQGGLSPLLDLLETCQSNLQVLCVLVAKRDFEEAPGRRGRLTPLLCPLPMSSSACPPACLAFHPHPHPPPTPTHPPTHPCSTTRPLPCTA